MVGFSRLAGADEDRILARLRALRSDLIDPTIAVHNGRVVKRTGDGSIVEFRSVVDAVRLAIEVQNAMVERNAGVPEDRRIVFRIGIHPKRRSPDFGNKISGHADYSGVGSPDQPGPVTGGGTNVTVCPDRDGRYPSAVGTYVGPGSSMTATASNAGGNGSVTATDRL